MSEHGNDVLGTGGSHGAIENWPESADIAMPIGCNKAVNGLA
jgi:hypothetical protein